MNYYCITAEKIHLSAHHDADGVKILNFANAIYQFSIVFDPTGNVRRMIVPRIFQP